MGGLEAVVRDVKVWDCHLGYQSEPYFRSGWLIPVISVHFYVCCGGTSHLVPLLQFLSIRTVCRSLVKLVQPQALSICTAQLSYTGFIFFLTSFFSHADIFPGFTSPSSDFQGFSRLPDQDFEYKSAWRWVSNSVSNATCQPRYFNSCLQLLKHR